MPKRSAILFLIIIFSCINQESFGQKVDSTSFKINTRLSFYSFEKSGEILVHIPPSHTRTSFNIRLITNNSKVGTWKGVPGKKLLRVPFSILLTPGNYKIVADITSSGGLKYKANCTLPILTPKPNEVKTDRFTGGLIVSRKIFFPFGFYCYSPVYPTLPEEEAVLGFNMISPYQKILPQTFKERKAYMDRCAQLGMKVHYNLLSVTGGAGENRRIPGLSEQESLELLKAEIKAFMDHPALLAWYISDEPTGNKIDPGHLENIYKLVQETDPWHPVSIVFMAPFLSSKSYANALDIVMADPYPVPNGSLSQAGDVAKQLKSVFEGEKPVWMVPQAFGGGEWWGREPSAQEIRSMTWQSIINGARGIQYFIRQGPNSFPKSTAAWSECSKMALEIAGITPWLLSDEDPVPVRTDSKYIQVSSSMHDGQLLIMAVNTINAPQKADIRVPLSGNKTARVLFENRSITMSSGVITDYIPAFGSQVYLVDTQPRKDTVQPYKGNLSRDPGFEDITSPGVPASCYAWNEGDRGATYFLDSREHLEGNHSLRMLTPSDNNGTRLRFFPVSVKNGRTYIISIWARTDNEINIPWISKGDTLSGNPKAKSPYFEIGLGEFGKEGFYPDENWKEYLTAVEVPENNSLPPRINVILRMPGAGIAWFDMLQVFEATDINRSVNPELRGEWETKW